MTIRRPEGPSYDAGRVQTVRVPYDPFLAQRDKERLSLRALRQGPQPKAPTRDPSRSPRGYRRSDVRIREDVCNRLSEGTLDASDVGVQVQDGEVILEGSVGSRDDKRLAEALADTVPGVIDIYNRLRVRAEGEPVAVDISTGERLT